MMMLWTQVKTFLLLVKYVESREITPETFAEMNLAFSVTSTDGKDIELIENGKNIKVNWENRQQYIKLVENYRLNEFKAQVEAIKSGLGTIVPNQLLSLFNWQELEVILYIFFSSYTSRWLFADEVISILTFWNKIRNIPDIQELMLLFLCSGKRWQPFLQRRKNFSYVLSGKPHIYL